jgi:chromate transport protein ChrA
MIVSSSFVEILKIGQALPGFKATQRAQRMVESFPSEQGGK